MPPRPLLVCVLLVLTAGSLTACTQADGAPIDHGPATPAVAEQGSAAEATYLWSCVDEDPVQQPPSYVLTCADGNAGLEGMSWSAWGEEIAHGQGEFVINSCDPSCAEGELVRFPVTVKAEDLVQLEATQVYGSVVVHFVDERPDGLAQDESFSVAPEHR
ncbi:hypothetical protein ACQBAT_14845 [Ornithinimicrobium sp. Y1847]|uniref:hypothetical protein n=1 Tax=unclassified Ornithinimicrobium TaxID=2615080 RepID=UPI003B674794